MSTIRAIEMKLADQLFERPNDRGYVLDFSNNTFSSFFAQELQVDIYDDRFSGRGTSKMNRLRCYLEVVNDAKAAQALQALWEYRETLGKDYQTDVPNGEKRLQQLIARLSGKPIPEPPKPAASEPKAVDPARLAALQQDLMTVIRLDPVPRGLAFERFLKDLFDAYGLEGRGSITLRGEQIDGSFRHDGHIYLIEAKWQNGKTGVADLHVFNGKVEQKAGWTRGLFISQSGFTPDGLHAFGRGKRVICMDGLDLWDTLIGKLTLPEVISRKVRRASETGDIYVPVRDLS